MRRLLGTLGTALAAVIALAGCGAAEASVTPGAQPIPTVAPAMAWSVASSQVLGGSDGMLVALPVGTAPADALYFAAYSSTGTTLTALSAADGTVKWQKSDAGWQTCTAAGSSLACYGGNAVDVLSPTDGSTTATYASPVPIVQALVVGDGAFVLSYDVSVSSPARITVLRLAGGGVAWQHDETIQPNEASNPSLSSNGTLVSAHAVRADWSPIVYRLADGTPWTTKSVGTPTLLPDGSVAASSPDGTAVVQPDGQLLMLDLGESRLPSVTDGSTAALPYLFYESFDYTTGLAAYGSQGELKWRAKRWQTIPAYCGGKLLVHDDGTGYGALDPATGAEAWTRDLTIEDGTDISCDGRYAAVQTGAAGSEGQKVEWIRMRDGQTVWTLSAGGTDWTFGALPAGFVIQTSDHISLYR